MNQKPSFLLTTFAFSFLFTAQLFSQQLQPVRAISISQERYFSPGMAREFGEFFYEPLEQLRALADYCQQLAIYSSNGTVSDAERAFFSAEFQDIRSEFTAIVNETRFFNEAPFLGDLNQSLFVDNLHLDSALQNHLSLPNLSPYALSSAGIQFANADISTMENAIAVRPLMGAVNLALRRTQYQANVLGNFPYYSLGFGYEGDQTPVTLQGRFFMSAGEACEAMPILINDIQDLEGHLERMSELAIMSMNPTLPDSDRVFLDQEFQTNLQHFAWLTAMGSRLFGVATLRGELNGKEIVRRNGESFWTSYIWRISNLDPNSATGIPGLIGTNVLTVKAAEHAQTALSHAGARVSYAQEQIELMQSFSCTN